MEPIMTPDEVILYARQQYNSVNDQFFSDSELYNHVRAAQDILAKECKVIENTYETSTVASQQEYTYPTNAIALKRITYNGKRLNRIKVREDDVLTGFDADTASTGEPTNYFIWDRIIYLRPVPSAIYTLKLFTFDKAQEVSSTSSLDVPDEFHLDLVNYILWRMAAKDQNFTSANYYKEEWSESVGRCKRWSRKRLTADGFNVVRDEDGAAAFWEALY
jgi:hypothetical protein